MKNLPGSRPNQVHCLLVRLECRGGFLDGSAGKESTCSVGDTEDSDSVLGSGRSLGGGNGHPLQYSYLENPMDRGSWGLQSMGSQRVRQDWGAKGARARTHTHTHTHTYTHTLRVQKGTLIHTCFPPLTQSCVFLPIMSIRFWIGHDCLCQRPKKIPLEPITGTSIFHTTLKGYIFIGSKEVCCPLGTVCHFRVIRLTCISLMENIMNGFDNPWHQDNVEVGSEVKV